MYASGGGCGFQARAEAVGVFAAVFHIVQTEREDETFIFSHSKTP